jgi:hypothetical protein
MCRFLLPLTALILLLFTVFLPFTGLEPLWATRHATPILLTLAFAHVVLLNGVVQDGRPASPYPPALRLMVDGSCLCLPLLTALAAYALWLRVGLTLVALLHAIALAWAVWWRTPEWLVGLRRSNPPLALFVVFLLVLLHVPALSPLQLSAASQYARLLDETLPAERTDLGALRFQLGEPGRRYLEQLRQRLAQPGLDETRREWLVVDLQRLDQADNYWQWRREQEIAIAPLVPWIGEALPDPDGSLARTVGPQGCANDCHLFAVDLDGDGQPEALLLRGDRPRIVQVLARNDSKGWHWIGHLRVTGDSTLDAKALGERLGQGQFEMVAPRFRAVQIDGVRLEPSISE